MTITSRTPPARVSHSPVTVRCCRVECTATSADASARAWTLRGLSSELRSTSHLGVLQLCQPPLGKRTYGQRSGVTLRREEATMLVCLTRAGCDSCGRHAPTTPSYTRARLPWAWGTTTHSLRAIIIIIIIIIILINYR